MKFTFAWLKEHLETDADLDAILEKLTVIGLEVEKVTDRAKSLESFVVGLVLEASQHPDADRLRVCRVDTGDGGEHQVVCGAPNARTGMKGVFAAEGIQRGMCVQRYPGLLQWAPMESYGILWNPMESYGIH